MGTRHLVAVFVDGEYRIAQYGQWDGYPDGQGRSVLQFLHSLTPKWKVLQFLRPSSKYDTFRAAVKNLVFLTQEEHQKQWIACGADPKNDFVNMDVAGLYNRLYPENDRDTGADILNMVLNSNGNLKLVNSLEFAGDSLFCEWAYCIDFDKMTFEIYEGFNTAPLSEKDRFYHLTKNIERREVQYYPVRLIKQYNLTNLPTEKDFLAAFQG